MARDPEETDIEALQAQIAQLQQALTDARDELLVVKGERDQAASTVQALEDDLDRLHAELQAAEAQIAALMSKKQSLTDRVGVLEQVCTDFRTILDRHHPAPKTDIEAAIDEFVAKVRK